jgi:hypothetical protein
VAVSARTAFPNGGASASEAMTPTVSETQIHQSPTKPTRLSLNSANPALLKADTAWKTPYQSDFPSP